MSHDGSYADHIAVAHMAKMLGITITIVEGENETIIGTGSPSVMLGYARDSIMSVLHQSPIPGMYTLIVIG